MKEIKKNIIGFIIGGIIFGGISYTIASQILATQVSYTNEKSESNVASVDGALTELYDLAEQCQSASIIESTIEYKGKDAEIIYLDPTNSNATCTSATSSNTETKAGCMRFYVYAEDEKYKYAILDHNTTGTVSGFYTAQSQVKEDTKDWDPNLQARNISAMEVYKITESTNNQTNWQVKDRNNFYFNAKKGNNGQGYGWLFDRTYECESRGCTTKDNGVYNSDNILGYWTSDARDLSYAWHVDYNGLIGGYDITISCLGVRPVIQIAK